MVSQLVTINARIANANNFRESLERTSPAAESLYMFFGRSTAWTNESVPPSPLDKAAEEAATRSKIIGAKKISITNTCFVIPRYTWTHNFVYTQYSNNDPDLFTKPFYVISSSNNVYKCLNNASGSMSLYEPTGTSTSVISTGDGYQWKFMYNLSSVIADRFLSSDWLPVPSGAQKTSFQTSVESNASYTAGGPFGGHGASAIEELGAVNVMITQSLENSESGVLPTTGTTYRQFGLWNNPKLLSNGLVATGSVYQVNSSNALIDENTGSILFVDNIQAITRNSSQTENLYIVLDF